MMGKQPLCAGSDHAQAFSQQQEVSAAVETEGLEGRRLVIGGESQRQRGLVREMERGVHQVVGRREHRVAIGAGEEAEILQVGIAVAEGVAEEDPLEELLVLDASSFDFIVVKVLRSTWCGP